VLTLHTAILLGTFKSDPRLPPPAGPLAVIERRGFMFTEDGNWPCWDNEQPLPVGTEATAYMRWDAELRAFRLGLVVHVRARDRILRIARSSRLCEMSGK
jgi:hypothetical protein